MREEIAKILIKWNMPTRQVAISEIVALFNNQRKLLYFLSGAVILLLVAVTIEAVIIIRLYSTLAMLSHYLLKVSQNLYQTQDVVKNILDLLQKSAGTSAQLL